MSETEPRKRGRPRSFYYSSDGKVVQSLDKALYILKVVSQGSGLALSEISESADIPAPTVYRALITMQQHGIVSFEEGRQLWRIDVEAFRIGNAFLANTSIAEQARPVMQALMVDTGETANLGIIAGTDVVFLGQVETHEPIRAFFRPGSLGSIHSSGIGKALFSYRPEAQARALAGALEMNPFTENTIHTVDHLLRARQTILQSGYAVDDEERTLGMRCIAAPIFNSFGEAVAAISISGPSVRIAPKSIAKTGAKVREAADEVTRNIGGKEPNLALEDKR